MSDTQYTAQQEELNRNMLAAARRQQIDAMEQAIRAGADVNRVSARGDSALQQALMSGHEGVALSLLDHGADANLGDKQGLTPLAIAARSGNLELMEVLLNKGAKVNPDTAHLDTPLLQAMLADKEEAAVWLIEHGADINAKTRTGSVPILVAADRKQVSVVKALLEKGADANSTDPYGTSPLIVACYGTHGSSEAQKIASLEADMEAKKKGPDASAGDSMDTPSMQIVALLLKANANINYAARSGTTALSNAAITGSWSACEALVDKGANLSVHSVEGPTGGYSPLMVAMLANKHKLAEKMLAKGADVHYRNSAGHRVSDLMLMRVAQALANGAPEAETKKARDSFKALLSKGGETDARTPREGMSMVHVGATFGDHELLQIGLHDEKALKVRTTNDETALHTCVAQRREKAVEEILASKKVDLNATDKQGHTALHILSFNPLPAALGALVTAMKGQEERHKQLVEKIHASARETAKQLIQAGANINAQDNDGYTPLMEAMRRARSEGFGPNKDYENFLIDNGADLSVRNKASDHAAMLAAKMGDVELFERLLKGLIAQGHQKMVDNFVVDSAYTAPEHPSQQEGFEKCLRKALEYGAKLEAMDDDGQKAVVVAAATNQEEFLGTLLRVGADVNAQNAEGETAMMHAISLNAANIVAVLIEAKADPMIKRLDGDTAWDIAYAKQRTTCLNQLRRYDEATQEAEAQRAREEQQVAVAARRAAAPR